MSILEVLALIHTSRYHQFTNLIFRWDFSRPFDAHEGFVSVGAIQRPPLAEAVEELFSTVRDATMIQGRTHFRNKDSYARA